MIYAEGMHGKCGVPGWQRDSWATHAVAVLFASATVVPGHAEMRKCY